MQRNSLAMTAKVFVERRQKRGEGKEAFSLFGMKWEFDFFLNFFTESAETLRSDGCAQGTLCFRLGAHAPSLSPSLTRWLIVRDDEKRTKQHSRIGSPLRRRSKVKEVTSGTSSTSRRRSWTNDAWVFATAKGMWWGGRGGGVLQRLFLWLQSKSVSKWMNHCVRVNNKLSKFGCWVRWKKDFYSNPFF